ncbi:hypothetical protein K458DRAFT_296588 [Lentithecium fluviatile CBS 122367]|uniref:GRF-like zinc ribbon domain-containing protein n=1 Tax=Lentithecium fluviatile CBS 122367 TaxID=1168545 RepID=A0A6G1JBJ4_9PLEO|nr:hypothetical protein K458DRAFT_296588 [Lentithecium fluviatile CBS 122367]
MSEILNALSRPLRAESPLSPPHCRHCNWTPRYRNITNAANQNGNGGRPYYKCVKCESRNLDTQPHTRGWITWDDDLSMCDSNPLCYCEAVSRQDRAGVRSDMCGWGFWTCATGGCGYFSKYRNGWTDEERAFSPSEPQCVRFVPWLL